MRRLIGLAALALAACAPAQQDPGIEVTGVWTRDTIGRTATAAVFMTIAAQTPDRLVGASTPVAARTDLMTMQMDAGTMGMVYIDGIVLPGAGTAVPLSPSGDHVWLDTLYRPLRAGETFPLTIEFEKAGKLEVEVAVIAPTAAPPAGT